MKATTFPLFLAGICCAAPIVMTAQETPEALAARQEAEERYRRLDTMMQDLIAANEAQQKRIALLSEEIRALRDETNRLRQQAASSDANDKLRRLADAIQQVDQKREADKQLILSELRKLGKSLTQSPPPSRPTPAPAVPKEGYEHVVRAGDTLSGIVQAFRDAGVKVSMNEVERANPNITDWTKIQPGQKIFIPASRP